jgi:putative MATE family efflux protein
MIDATSTGRQLDRRVFALAVPAVGALLADPLLGVVDTAVAGRVSVTALGALGLGTALLGAGTWIFNFLVFGTTSAVARAAGAGRGDLAGRRVVHATAVADVLGVVVAVAVFVGAQALVRLSGAVDDLVEPATAYLRVRAVGLPFVLVAMVGHGAFRGVGDTRTPLLVVVVANVVNATLDIVLVVFGDGGLVGIAWATVAAEVVAVAMLAVLIRRTGLELSGHGLPSRSEVGVLLRVSRDVVLRTGGLVGGLLLVAAAAARIDAATAAGHQVLYQVFILAAFAQDSLAIAGQSLVGNALGRDDRDLARRLARRLLGWGTLLGLAYRRRAATRWAGWCRGCSPTMPRWSPWSAPPGRSARSSRCPVASRSSSTAC